MQSIVRQKVHFKRNAENAHVVNWRKTNSRKELFSSGVPNTSQVGGANIIKDKNIVQSTPTLFQPR